MTGGKAKVMAAFQSLAQVFFIQGLLTLDPAVIE